MTSPTGDRRPVARLRPGGRGSAADWHRLRRRLVRDARSADLADQQSTVDVPAGQDEQAGRQTGSSRLREWHLLSPTERAEQWTALVNWMVWLNDRYELSIQERLPRCWHLHPGLIEELSALKAWRDDIYQAAEPSGQAARYWHGELQQVITAATTIYAAGCRAGHRTATDLAAADAELRAGWHAADPLTGIPPQLLTTSTPTNTGNGNLLPDEAIQQALRDGTARPLGQHITEHIHHDGTWWTAGPQPGTWARITDDALTTTLNAAAERMAVADATVAHRKRLRDAFTAH